MNLADLLGAGFRCTACGRDHCVPVRGLVVGDDMTEVVRQAMPRYGVGPVVSVLADSRTWDVAGREVQAGLASAGARVVPTVIPDPAPGRSPICDDSTRDRLDGEVPRVDSFWAVGGGVVCDLAKWLSWDRQVPFVAVATAASMNGYSSANIAPTLHGVKSLLRGHCPTAVVASMPVLCQAPRELTAAGLGDALAKGVSSADWLLNHLLFNDFYCQFCVDLVADIEPLYLHAPEAIGRSDPRAVRALFDALVGTGLAMTLAGTSAPASGGEHLISHTLDMMGALDGHAHDLHGRQVGVAAVVCAALWQQVLAQARPRFAVVARPTDEQYWGPLTAAVEAQHARKRDKAAAAVAVLRTRPELWASIVGECGRMARAPGVFRDCLRRARAASRLADIGVSRSRFLDAFLHAHEVRDRYTVLDLAWATGVLPGQAGSIIDEWVVQ